MHVVITGASSGIGEALARAFASERSTLTLVARRTEPMHALAATLAGRVRVVRHDLCEPGTAADWLPAAERDAGPVDVLVNNAGVQNIERTSAMDCDSGERLLRLNLLTPLRLARAVLPGMLANGRGTIVNVASMAALAPTPGMTYYNASKGGLAAASEALRGELLRTPVNVVTVYPGIIPTAMGSAGLEKYHPTLAVRLQPTGTTEGLAKLVLAAVERRSARVIYPRSYVLSRWFPGTTRWMMDRFSPPLNVD